MLTLNNQTWTPAIDLQETNREIILKAQIPGVRTEELRLRVEENALTIVGEHQERQCSTDDFLYQELHHGKFGRVINLPAAVETNRAIAELVDGILTVVMQKKQ